MGYKRAKREAKERKEKLQERKDDGMGTHQAQQKIGRKLRR